MLGRIFDIFVTILTVAATTGNLFLTIGAAKFGRYDFAVISAAISFAGVLASKYMIIDVWNNHSRKIGT